MTEVEQVMCYVQNGMAHKHHLTVIYCDFGVVVKSDMEFCASVRPLLAEALVRFWKDLGKP